MSIVKRSKSTMKSLLHVETITLIYQFFIHDNKNRNKEIKCCLKNNVLNKHISRIILLNERIYSEDELGINSNKIEQINIGKRLEFSDIFDIVESKNIQGYIITANADIFYNDTLKNIYYSQIDMTIIFFPGTDPKKSMMFLICFTLNGE